ncbi:MAG: tetratricopeptide repeat protein [Gracilibacteraceae bacterium]|jgi:predicted Zn-dependent protease|nr:tetratricopeptide repeat protein [Gracilibacteraceae bacterium]
MKKFMRTALLATVVLLLSACVSEEEKNYEESYARGTLALTEGDYDTAVTELTGAMDSRDEDVLVWIQRGDAYMALEQYEDAVSDYENALVRDAAQFDVYDKLAECYRLLGDPEVANETLARKEEAAKEAARGENAD